MNFLSPWFLAAAVLVAGPIVAHLIRRATRDRVTFSATRFLETSPPRLQRRNRLQHPWLLLLRCLVVGLLAAAFARPFFRSETSATPTTEAAQEVVIVLDESASMRRTGIWNEARDRVLHVAEALHPNDRCTVLLGSSTATRLLSADQWTQLPASDRSAQLRTLLAAREPSWGPFFLDTAIDSALEGLAEGPKDSFRQRVIVVSDFASGTRISGLAGRDWPPGCEVAFERTSSPMTNNAGVQFLGWSEVPGGPPQARLRITRDQGTLPLPLTLQLHDGLSGGALGAAQSIDLTSGETRLVLLPIPPGATGPFEAALSGDGEPFDNRAWFVPVQARTTTIAYVGRHEANDPSHAHFYISRALSSARDTQVTITPVEPEASSDRVGKTTLLVVAEPPGPALLEALRARVQEGAFAVVTLTSPEMIATAAALAGETNWSAGPAEKGPALLGQIDFAHPLFSLFADPRFSDFSHLRFWRAQPVTLPAGSPTAVVAQFDDGSPAVLESTVGRGRVITWAGEWSPAASQWVLSTKFVPWLQALLERASGGPPRPSYTEITQAGQLTRDPSARWRSAQAAADAFEPLRPQRPGLYQLKDYDSTRWIALELPPEESRTDLLPLDTFEQLGVPTKPPTQVKKSGVGAPGSNVMDAAALEIEGRQKLWRWLLIITAALLALESLMAWSLGRRENPTPSLSTGG